MPLRFGSPQGRPSTDTCELSWPGFTPGTDASQMPLFAAVCRIALVPTVSGTPLP